MAEATPPVQNETREQTAFRLMERVLRETWVEGTPKPTQKVILDTYTACLEAVNGKRPTS